MEAKSVPATNQPQGNWKNPFLPALPPSFIERMVGAADRLLPETTVEWFLMRAAGHVSGPCVGNVWNGTCPRCKAQEILMNLAAKGAHVPLAVKHA